MLGEDEASESAAFDPFKTDAYSFGVTLLLMLLGEECAEVQQEDDGMWMIPRRCGERSALRGARSPCLSKGMS